MVAAMSPEARPGWWSTYAHPYTYRHTLKDDQVSTWKVGHHQWITIQVAYVDVTLEIKG